MNKPHPTSPTTSALAFGGKSRQLCRAFLLPLFGLGLGAVYAEPIIKVGNLSANREPVAGSGAYYTLNGAFMQTSTRAKLLAPANFRPSGTVQATIQITDDFAAAGSMTAAALANYDVIFVGKLDTALSAAELNTLNEWSKFPGKVMISGTQPYGNIEGHCNTLNPGIMASVRLMAGSHSNFVRHE